jgi:hypothetical protein
MTESESSFQEAISRAAAVSVSQGLLCLNIFTNHRENRVCWRMLTSWEIHW